MWPFSLKWEAPRRVVVVDVGTDAVGCAVSALADGQPSRLLYSVRVPMVLAHEPRTADRVLERVRSAARHAFDRTAAFTHHYASDIPISRLSMFLSSPWSSLYVRNVRFTSPEAARADKTLLDRLAYDYLKRQRPDADESIIERVIANVRLDGSSVVGVSRRASANRVEMTALTSGAHTPMLHSMRDEAARAFGIRPHVSFHNADAAYARALSAVKPDRGDFVLCNVGGEVTSLFVAREHVPAAVATMPYGSHLPLRTLVTHHHLTPDEARSALAVSLDTEAPMHDRLHDALRQSGASYADEFAASFARIAPMTGSTPTLYTLGDSAGDRWSANRITQAPVFQQRYPLGLRKEHINDAWLSRHGAVQLDPRCAPDARLSLAALSCLL